MQTYAQAIHVTEAARKFPSRFAAIDALFSAVTSAGRVVERAAIPGDSGLDAMLIFAEAGSEDAFLISRINDSTFMIVRRPQGRSAILSTALEPGPSAIAARDAGESLNSPADLAG